MKEIVIWGATGQAKVLHEFITGEYEIIALIDQNKEVISPFAQVPLFHSWKEFQTKLDQTLSNEKFFAVAIGGIYRGRERQQIHELLVAAGLKPANLIHPEAYIASDALMGEGNQIMAKAVLCAEVKIGSQCLINTAATVDHESLLGNGVHICPGAHLLGDVHIGNYVTVGAGAIILPHIKVGEGAVIGAGSVVLEDVAPNTVMVGNPGKIIKQLE